jgi:hypothetical protein
LPTDLRGRVVGTGLGAGRAFLAAGGSGFFSTGGFTAFFFFFFPFGALRMSSACDGVHELINEFH